MELACHEANIYSKVSHKSDFSNNDLPLSGSEGPKRLLSQAKDYRKGCSEQTERSKVNRLTREKSMNPSVSMFVFYLCLLFVHQKSQLTTGQDCWSYGTAWDIVKLDK